MSTPSGSIGGAISHTSRSVGIELEYGNEKSKLNRTWARFGPAMIALSTSVTVSHSEFINFNFDF